MSLNQIAKELDTLSPEMQALLRVALTGANGEAPCADARERDMARCYINEALTTRTKAAKLARAA